MRANNTINKTNNYLNGFSDVYNHKTFLTTVSGIFKIISYCLFIPPIIAKAIRLKNKKIIALQNSNDQKIDKLSQSIFSPANDQKTLISYLINKLVHFEQSDNRVVEQARFAKGFKQLSFESQKTFFEKAHQSGCMRMAIEWLPKDITELNFVSGPTHPIGYSQVNAQNIRLLLKELPSFSQLRKLELNLKGLGFYGSSIDNDIQLMSLPGGAIFAHSADTRTIFEIDGMVYRHSNDTLPIIETIRDLKQFIQTHPRLEWYVRFTNFGFGGEGRAINSITVMGNLNPSEAVCKAHLDAYLKKQ